MDDETILGRVSALVEREHQLRTARGSGSLDEGAEHEELQAVEVELDQCWDLLRQRRAKQEFDADPGEAVSRPESVVENYQQ